MQIIYTKCSKTQFDFCFIWWEKQNGEYIHIYIYIYPCIYRVAKKDHLLFF